MCFHRSPTIHWWYFRGGIYEVKKASKSGQMLLCQKETHVTKTTDGVAKRSKGGIWEALACVHSWERRPQYLGCDYATVLEIELSWKLNCPGPQMGSSDMTKNGKTIRSDWDGIQWCRPQHRQWLMHWMYDAVLMRGPLLGWVRPAELVVKLARHPPQLDLLSPWGPTSKRLYYRFSLAYGTKGTFKAFNCGLLMPCMA